MKSMQLHTVLANLHFCIKNYYR